MTLRGLNRRKKVPPPIPFVLTVESSTDCTQQESTLLALLFTFLHFTVVYKTLEHDLITTS